MCRLGGMLNRSHLLHELWNTAVQAHLDFWPSFVRVVSVVDLWLTCDHFVCKVSAVGQQPGQLSLLSLWGR